MIFKPFSSKSHNSNERDDVHWPSLPENHAVFAIGDVHGCADLFRKAVDWIFDRASRDLNTQFHFVPLGDYCDRGPDTAQVYSQLIALEKQTLPANLQMVPIKGNHDEAIHSFYKGEHPEFWFDHGGIDSLESYGISIDYGKRIQDQIDRLQEEFGQKFPKEHADFIESLPRYFELGDYLFTHAGIRPGLPLLEQTDRDLMWIREPFLSYTERHMAYVVHGHSPVSRPEILDNRAGIDTKAYKSGLLSGLFLEGNEKSLHFFSN